MFMSNILHSPNPNALESPFISPLLDRPTPDVCAMDRFTRLCMLSLHPTMCDSIIWCSGGAII